jgi:hypothetical protein
MISVWYTPSARPPGCDIVPWGEWGITIAILPRPRVFHAGLVEPCPHVATQPRSDAAMESFASTAGADRAEPGSQRAATGTRADLVRQANIAQGRAVGWGVPRTHKLVAVDVCRQRVYATVPKLRSQCRGFIERKAGCCLQGGTRHDEADGEMGMHLEVVGWRPVSVA